MPLVAAVAWCRYTNPGLPDLLASFTKTLPARFQGFEANMKSWLTEPGMPLVTLSLRKGKASTRPC